MNLNLNCAQVMALIKFYVEGKLNPVLEKSVSAHLSVCEECKYMADELKYVLYPPDTTNEQEITKKEDNSFFKSLSAYIDNELSTNDNIKIKKIAISNPEARDKLENMYKFQKLMHSAYQKTRNDLKTDYSKNIIAILTDTTENYATNYFKKIIILFLIIIGAILSGFLYLYF